MSDERITIDASATIHSQAMIDSLIDAAYVEIEKERQHLFAVGLDFDFDTNPLVRFSVERGIPISVILGAVMGGDRSGFRKATRNDPA